MFQKPTAATHYVCRRLRKTNIHTFHTTLTFPSFSHDDFPDYLDLKRPGYVNIIPVLLRISYENSIHSIYKILYSMTIYTHSVTNIHIHYGYIYIYIYRSLPEVHAFSWVPAIHYLIQYVLPVYLHFSFVHILYIIDRSIYAHTLPAEYFDPNRRYNFWDEPPGISYLSLAPLSHFFHTMQVCTYIARKFLLRKSIFFSFFDAAVFRGEIKWPVGSCVFFSYILRHELR